ncbi:unnamed protein product, partial [Effrenium voratum]
GAVGHGPLGELHRVLCPVKRHALQRIKSFLKIVARLVKERVANDTRAVPADGGMAFEDTDDDDSDSGLEG